MSDGSIVNQLSCLVGFPEYITAVKVGFGNHTGFFLGLVV